MAASVAGTRPITAADVRAPGATLEPLREVVAHTPRPWCIEFKQGNPDIASGVPGGGPVIAGVQHADGIPASDADAHLIAAAPDLLAALRDMVRTCRPAPAIAGSGVMALRAGRAAIAKAEGRR